MKKLFLLFALAAASFTATAQISKPVSEDSPFSSEGIEYGYAIKNAATREVGNKDYSRYEVTLYATNKSECSRVVFFGQGLNWSEAENKVLARFDCINATGARLTSKSAEVDAKPMFVNARVYTRDEKGKPITEMQKVQVGYYIGAGETVEASVIFIVPLNNKPDIKLRVMNRVSVL